MAPRVQNPPEAVCTPTMATYVFFRVLVPNEKN